MKLVRRKLQTARDATASGTLEHWPSPIVRFQPMRKHFFQFAVIAFTSALYLSTGFGAQYELLIRNGLIYDGSGKTPVTGDLAINGDTIAAVGKLEGARGKRDLDARGLAVAPGFINMLSWATESLIQDGRSQSGIRQGVTLEIMGEGSSMGPLNEKMKKDTHEEQGD